MKHEKTRGRQSRDTVPLNKKLFCRLISSFSAEIVRECLSNLFDDIHYKGILSQEYGL